MCLLFVLSFRPKKTAASAATAAAAATAASNETHRMKMAASFHQRVVVGEDKPVNNNLSRDNHHAPRESPSSEDRHRIYQGRSREVVSPHIIELILFCYLPEIVIVKTGAD